MSGQHAVRDLKHLSRSDCASVIDFVTSRNAITFTLGPPTYFDRHSCAKSTASLDTWAKKKKPGDHKYPFPTQEGIEAAACFGAKAIVRNIWKNRCIWDPTWEDEPGDLWLHELDDATFCEHMQHLVEGQQTLIKDSNQPWPSAASRAVKAVDYAVEEIMISPSNSWELRSRLQHDNEFTLWNKHLGSYTLLEPALASVMHLNAFRIVNNYTRKREQHLVDPVEWSEGNSALFEGLERTTHVSS